MQVWLLMTHLLVLKDNHWTIDSSGKPVSLLLLFFLTKVRLDNSDISKIFQTPRTSYDYKLLLRFGYGSMNLIRAVKYKHSTTAALVCCGTVNSTTNFCTCPFLIETMPAVCLSWWASTQVLYPVKWDLHELQCDILHLGFQLFCRNPVLYTQRS